MASINSLGETKVAREFELGMGLYHTIPYTTNPTLRLLSIQGCHLQKKVAPTRTKQEENTSLKGLSWRKQLKVDLSHLTF